MFFTSLVTPAILLVLYMTFLQKVFKDSFLGQVDALTQVPEKLINGTVGGELASSLLAVCCVTVAFCSNMLMVQDKVNGPRRDLTMAPVRGSVLALGYYIATVISTAIVCYTAMALCLLYLAAVGWYLSLADVLLLFCDVFLLVLFGTALSSLINFFLNTQGQISAVGTVVSAGYGFLCGAYMPIASFGEGLQKVLMFLPGTYGTSLIRNHMLRGVYREMAAQGFPADVVEGIKESIDCNLYFFGHKVEIYEMYAVLAGAVALLIFGYVLLNAFHREAK